MDQLGFQARRRFAGTLALGAEVRIGLHVVETEGDQHLALGLDGLYAAAHQMLGVRSGDDGVDVPVIRLIDRAGQRPDGARQERIAILRRNLARTVEITDTPGDQLVLLDLRQFGTIDQFGFQQSALETGRRLILAVAAGAHEGIAPEIADPELDQRTLPRVIDADVTLDQFLGVGTGDFDVEVAGDGVFGGPDECGDSASQERLRTAATTDRNLPDTLQAGVALGVKIEVALRVGSRIGHGESPMGMKRRHTGPDCAGGA